jgi:hypothetical protein
MDANGEIKSETYAQAKDPGILLGVQNTNVDVSLAWRCVPSFAAEFALDQ